MRRRSSTSGRRPSAIAERQLADADLIAPSDGMVLSRVREVGAIVQAGETVFVLSLTSPVWVRTYVSEPDLGRIKPGMDVSVHTDMPGGKVYSGKVGFISTAAEFTPKTVETTRASHRARLSHPRRGEWTARTNCARGCRSPSIFVRRRRNARREHRAMTGEPVAIIDTAHEALRRERRRPRSIRISFSIKSGQVTGVAGPDGAGKTTLMRLMAGLLAPTRRRAHGLRLRHRSRTASRCITPSATCRSASGSMRT